MVDSLRSQLEQKDKALQKAEEDLLSLGRQLGQEQADHRRAKETATVELSRIKNVNGALQRQHEEDITKLRMEQSRVAQDYQRQLDHAQKTAEVNAERTRKRMGAEIADLQSNINRLEADLTKANKNHLQDLQTAHEEYTTNQFEQAARLQRAEEKANDFEARSNAAQEKSLKSELLLAERESQIKAVQSELDDLLMVFGDLEDKATKYKERLKALNEHVSDGEEADDDEEGYGESEDDVD
jgi:chromosome segregation ATPase